MKVKQKSIRAFEFTIADPAEEAELRSYIEQNIEILANFLISIEGDVSGETTDFLASKGLKFVIASSSLHNKERPKPNRSSEPPLEIKNELPEGREVVHYNLPIRSGTELECDDDIVVFGRINSGAKVIAKKNAIIFSRIEGLVEAAGDYLIVKEIGKGQLFFHGEEVPPGAIKGHLTKITMQGGVIAYEEL